MWRTIAIAGLAVAGCDGTTGEASPDASVGEIAVRVEVSADQSDVARSVVVFNDPSGSVLDVGLLDERGRATGRMVDGGSVTVIWPPGYREGITTVLAVSPGDEIGFAHVLPREPLVGHVQVEFSPDPDATLHSVRLCGGTIGVPAGQSSVSMGLVQRCTTTLVDVTVFSTTADGVRKYVTSPNRLALPGGTLRIEGAYRPLETFTATLRGLPTEVGRAAASMSLYDDGRFLEDHGGAFAAPVGGTVASELRYAPAGDSMSVRSHYELAGTQRYQLIEDRIPASDSYDATPALLPWVLDATLEPAASAIEIAVQGDGAADVALAEVVAGGAAGPSLLWMVIGPGTRRVLTFPELPPPYDRLRPTGDEPFPYAAAALYAVDGAGGYPALRQVFLDVMGRYPRSWDGATFRMSGDGPYW